MALPSDVQLVTVTCGSAYSFFGDDVTVEVEVEPVLGGNLKHLVHKAGGTVMAKSKQKFTGTPGQPASFTVPDPSQAETWVDGSGNFFSGWPYSATITVRPVGSVPVVWIKAFTVAPGQTSIDLDLVPNGQVGGGVSAPVPAVTDVNGQTGSVIIEAEPLTSDAVAANLTVEAVDAKLPERLTASGLSATIDASILPVLEGVDGLVSALDMRDPRPLVIAQASDSTGDSAAEWFETSWKEMLAENWPERPAQVKRWIKATDVYGAMTNWQTATTPGGTASLTLADDPFTTDRALLAGSSAVTGGVWTRTGTVALTVAGGEVYPSGTGLAWATLAPTTHDPVNGTSTVVAAMTGTGAVQQLIHIHAAAGDSSTSDRLDIIVGGTASITPILRVSVGGSLTTLATFTTGLVALNTSTPVAVTTSITVEGLNVSATINGETKTATLTTEQKAAIGDSRTGFGMNNALPSRVSSFQRTGFTTTTATESELGYFTAYNAGYAGGRAEHQLARLDAMFPERPDALFINHGHNYSTVASTPSDFLAAIQTFVDALHGKYPDVPVVCLSQNPEFVGSMANATEVAQHASRQRALRAYCIRKGWGYIPSFEAFAALTDFGRTLVNVVDGIHPESGGMRLQTDTAKLWVSSQSKRP